MSDADKPSKDNSVVHSFTEKEKIDDVTFDEWNFRLKKIKSQYLDHKDKICASCKKTLRSGKNNVKISIEDDTIHYFHFECWESVNSVLDSIFKVNKDQ